MVCVVGGECRRGVKFGTDRGSARCPADSSSGLKFGQVVFPGERQV
jgi:hypothetical protein